MSYSWARRQVSSFKVLLVSSRKKGKKSTILQSLNHIRISVRLLSEVFFIFTVHFRPERVFVLFFLHRFTIKSQAAIKKWANNIFCMLWIKMTMRLFWSSTQRPQTGPEPQPVSTAKGCTYVIALYGLSTTVLGKSEQTFLSEAVPTNTFCAGAAVQALLFFFHAPAMISVYQCKAQLCWWSSFYTNFSKYIASSIPVRSRKTSVSSVR